MKKVAAVFDFDGTLSRGECGLRFFRYLLGRKNFIQFAIKNSFWLSCYGFHVQDENALRKITQSVFQGKSAAEVAEVGEKFARDVMPRYLNPTMIQRLKWHQERGHRCIVISRSFGVYTRAWAKNYGVAEISVTELETTEDGTFTGKILGDSCVGPEKARRLHALLGDRSQYIVYAYGDSDGDKELLAEADYAYQLRTEHIPFTANPFPTVLITGASSGIGYQLAHRFAQQHHNLVIVGRDSERLEQLAQDCREKYQCQVLTIVKDLSEPNAAYEIVGELQERNCHIDVLVNNAGTGLWGDFMETDVKAELAMVQLQINFMLTLTKLLLPEMRDQKAGKILNVGSVYSYTPVPLQSVYAATKAFIRSFSMALREELQGTGISVTFLGPGITYTKFRTRAGVGEKKSVFGMSSESVARIAYRAMTQNKAVVIPGAFNKFYIRAVRFFPVRWVKWVVYKARGFNVDPAKKTRENPQ